MAVKDHSLDDKIIQAAQSEFLKHGFQKASLHKIAELAGITTGALYTRYKNKDALYCSLLKDVLTEIRTNAEPIHDLYYEVQQSKDPKKLLEVIHREERAYIELLFRHYEQCVLLICKNTGSSIETMIQTMMETKAKQTVAYLKSIAKKDYDLDGIELIMQDQFHFYKMLLERGYDKEKALSCLETVLEFQEAGWKALFEKIL